MSTVITVENLGKKYTLHYQQREQYTTLRDVITNGVRNFSKMIFSPFSSPTSPVPTVEDFWALKDVSFEVKQGDRIGIIGRNGAGKSTLLKILSRITEPTIGSVRIKGRVASLLEVGTGFHPELTGRENIFLNGAILGMGRAEIKKKFDEIVYFAEIEKFLDTPVKRYSSGMYVRLAFAVAAHLEPEILIVDEVLAVGDAQFQKKCLGKMEDVSTKEGRTVLFVSHNMSTVLNMCNKGIFLNSGQVLLDSEIDKVVNCYVLSIKTPSLLYSIESKYIESFEIICTDKEMPSIKLGESLKLRIKINDLLALPNVHIGLAFKNIHDQKVCTYTSAMQNNFCDILKRGQKEFYVEVHLPLIPGQYSIELSVVQRGIALLECHNNVGEFSVLEGDFYGTGRELTANDGFFLVNGSWH